MKIILCLNFYVTIFVVCAVALQGADWGRVQITKDERGLYNAILENSRIRVRYGRYINDEHKPEDIIVEFVIKDRGRNQAGHLMDACASRGPFSKAQVKSDGPRAKTLHLEWDDGEKASDVSIFKDTPYIRIDYLKYGVNVVDIGSPGGSEDKGEYEIYGATKWKRKYLAYPKIYFDRTQVDVGYQNVSSIDEVGPLDYHGWFIMGVYNPANKEGFGRVVPVEHIDIVKLLSNRGFELFPHFDRGHKAYAGYLYAVTGGAGDVLAVGMNLADLRP